MEPVLDDISPFAILYGQIEGLIRGSIQLLPNIAAAIVLIALTALVSYAAARLVTSAFRRSRSRPSLVSAVGTLTRLMVWMVGLMVAVTVVFPNLTPARLLTGLGIGSIAVGLAFKDIFENFLAGFLILLRKPMRIGDDIECGDLSGKVERITIRDTFLRQRSGELVLVPNSFIFKNPVNILTDQQTRRIDLIVGVAYGEDVDASRDVIRAAVERLETRAPDSEVQVFAREFNSSSVDFLVRWWTDSPPPSEHRSRDEAVAGIKRALDEAGIEIPFPYRTLTFKEPLPLARSDEDPESRAA